jgi:LAO/AO transport system kinase
VLRHNETLGRTGELAELRRKQQVKWLWSMLEDRVFARLKSDARLRAKLPQLEAAVADGRLSAALAAEEIASALGL